jgi:hypothetical protein
VRTLAVQRLREQGADDDARGRLAEHLVRAAAELFATGSQRWDPATFSRLLSLYDTIASTLRWCLDHDDDPTRSLLLCSVLWGVVHQGHTDEVSGLAEATIERWPDTSVPFAADAVATAATARPHDLGSAAAARSWIETVTDEVLAHPAIVRLAAPEPAAPADLRRRDGRSVFERHGAVRYTTHATLAIEQEVIDIVTAGRRAGRGVADADAVQRSIASTELGDDQAAAVRDVTLDGDAVTCVVGPAGTGKSRTMRAATAAWQACGVPVRGSAVSAVAAGVLQAEAGVRIDTVAKLLFEHDGRGAANDGWRLRRGEVVVVDEASMLASRDLARLAQLAHRAEAKLVLVGDHAQLGAVEAGGLFRLLVDIDAVELSGVWRFSVAWERDASLRLRARDPVSLSSTTDTGESRPAIGSALSTPPSPPGTTPALSARPWSSAPPTTPLSLVSLDASAPPESRPVRSSQPGSPPPTGRPWARATRSSRLGMTAAS